MPPLPQAGIYVLRSNFREWWDWSESIERFVPSDA